jgi:hypothetical protein
MFDAGDLVRFNAGVYKDRLAIVSAFGSNNARYGSFEIHVIFIEPVRYVGGLRDVSSTWSFVDRVSLVLKRFDLLC